LGNNAFGVRSQALRGTALDSMSDKLQFVDASIEVGTAENDKLKFIGHKSAVVAALCWRTLKSVTFSHR